MLITSFKSLRIPPLWIHKSNLGPPKTLIVFVFNVDIDPISIQIFDCPTRSFRNPNGYLVLYLLTGTFLNQVHRGPFLVSYWNKLFWLLDHLVSSFQMLSVSTNFRTLVCCIFCFSLYAMAFLVYYSILKDLNRFWWLFEMILCILSKLWFSLLF